MLKKNAVILFQGDSVTDCSRDRMDNDSLGKGYPLFVAGNLQYKYHTENLTFINKGISGNRIVDLYARIKEEIINIQPDILSILIGINDVWHDIEANRGVEANKFERIYRMLLTEVQEKLPNTKLVIMEPFVLYAEPRFEKWNVWEKEIIIRQSIVKKLAQEFNAIFVPLQEKLNAKSVDIDPSHWAKDGVHPSPAGHALIADEWIQTVLL